MIFLRVGHIRRTRNKNFREKKLVVQFSVEGEELVGNNSVIFITKVKQGLKGL